MNELKEFIQYFGFPIAVIVFGVWKGIPWIQKQQDKYSDKLEALATRHNQAIRELIDNHEAKMSEKDKKIESIVQDALDNNKMAMEIVQANTSAIQALISDLSYLKETNIQLKQTVDKTHDLTNTVRIYLERRNAG